MAEKKLLSQLLGEVKGSLSGIIISLKGELIEVSKRKTITEPGFIRGEMAIIHKIANSLGEDLKFDKVNEIIISFPNYTIVSLMIKDSYALILFLDNTANLGLARKKMNSIIPELAKDL